MLLSRIVGWLTISTLAGLLVVVLSYLLKSYVGILIGAPFALVSTLALAVAVIALAVRNWSRRRA